MTRYLNFMSSTALMIVYYYNGNRMSDHYDNIFIVENYASKEKIDQLIKLKVNVDIDAMLEDNPNLDPNEITYKVYKNRYYLNNDFNTEYKG